MQLLRKNWWMVTFFCLVGLFFWQNSRKTYFVAADLQERLADIMEQQRLVALERDDLLLQIQSQKDPKWVELILMRRLGLIPEGQTKVYFEQCN
jgi:hypothetical protein